MISHISAGRVQERTFRPFSSSHRKGPRHVPPSPNMTLLDNCEIIETSSQEICPGISLDYLFRLGIVFAPG